MCKSGPLYTQQTEENSSLNLYRKSTKYFKLVNENKYNNDYKILLEVIQVICSVTY